MSRVIELYDYLHTIPEIGYTEFKTSEFLAGELKKAGFEVQTNLDGQTGLVGVYDTKVPGPVIALRADIDALGHIVDGKRTAIHSCGHDGHMSMVLTAAEELIKSGAIKKGVLKIVFQPAEELCTGALTIINSGVLDDVNMILGVHVRPIQEVGMDYAAPALYHSASERLKAVFHGVQAHGSRPHLGVNAIEAAMLAIMSVGSIKLDPNASYSIKPTYINSDSGVTNAIPAEATVIWDVRTGENNDMDELLKRARIAIKSAAESIGATADVENYDSLPAAEYTQDAIDLLSESIINVYGKDNIKKPVKTTGSEDFHFYIKKVPNISAGYFALGCDLTPGIHHPDMTFNKNALEKGKDVFIYAVKKMLG